MPAKPRKTSPNHRKIPQKLSRLHRPPELAVADWQRQLRRQFGREQTFSWKNIGGQPFFSEFEVINPASRGQYRIAIRGSRPGENFCSCADFATNELGTCKHIEFVLAKLEPKRGFAKAMATGFRPTCSELYLRYGPTRSVHFRPGTDCPARLVRAARLLFKESHEWLLPPERFPRLVAFQQEIARSGHELRAYEDALRHVAATRDAARREAVLRRLFPKGAADARLTDILQVPLYRYQAEGALFAVRAGRALIGDEMGLGKTAQAIAAAEILQRHLDVTRILIVCPTSLKYQWQSEIRRFAGHDSRIIGGGRTQRESQFLEKDRVKITNYEKLRADLDLISHWSPELVIVDEAQRVKNWNTIAARALKRIDCPYAIVLTGTPLENKLEELVSIVQFVDQFRLGPTWKLLHDHQIRDGGRVVGYTGLDRIGATLAPVMIRRRKSEVALQLPRRTDQTLLVPMTPQQLRLHEENAETVARIVARWRKTRFLSERDQRILTCALQNMRMSCNSTYLLDRRTDHGHKADEVAALLDGVLDDAASKAVIFSQWTATHELLIRRLEARGLGHVSFHGGVPSEKRPGLIARFRDDPACRVFLSTDAGSTGLNLQHATTIINMDLPWNPAVLEQRIARIHRMGQRKPVRVVNFVAKGTIEDAMQSVLSFKKSLAAGVLDGGDAQVSLGGSRLTRFMKDIEQVTGRIVPAPAVVEEGASPAPGEAQADPTASMAEEASQPAPAPGTSWQALAGLGVDLLTALIPGTNTAQAGRSLIERDGQTGATSLRIPLPSPEAATQLAQACSMLVELLRPLAERRSTRA